MSQCLQREVMWKMGRVLENSTAIEKKFEIDDSFLFLPMAGWENRRKGRGSPFGTPRFVFYVPIYSDKCQTFDEFITLQLSIF